MPGVAADRAAAAAALATAARRAVRRAMTILTDDGALLPEQLTPEARRAIATYAHGGRSRLQMVLATALFLAEKEHRPRVDLALVQRAVALQTPTPIPVPVPAPPPAYATAPPTYLPWAAASLILLTFASLGYQWVMTRRAALAPGFTTFLLSDAPLPAQFKLAPQIPMLNPPATWSWAVPVTSQQISPIAGPGGNIPASMWQPTDPAATIVLRYATSSSGAAAQAHMVQTTLQAAGFVVTTVPQRRHPRSASLRFFYAQDGDAASLVQKTLALTTISLKPAPISTRQVPPPGTIELYLP